MPALLSHDFTPKRMTLGDKLQRLAELAPEKLAAIEVLADLALADVARKILLTVPDRSPY